MKMLLIIAGASVVVALAIAQEKFKTCTPERGASRETVLATCGEPDSSHRSLGQYALYEELIYGKTVVGLVDGSVAYVLR